MSQSLNMRRTLVCGLIVTMSLGFGVPTYGLSYIPSWDLDDSIDEQPATDGPVDWLIYNEVDGALKYQFRSERLWAPPDIGSISGALILEEFLPNPFWSRPSTENDAEISGEMVVGSNAIRQRFDARSTRIGWERGFEEELKMTKTRSKATSV